MWKWPGGVPSIEGSGLDTSKINEAIEGIILAPLAWLLALLLGGSADDWNSLEEIEENFVPALIKRILGPLASLFSTGTSTEVDSDTSTSLLSSIPILGDVVKALQGITSGLTGGLFTAATSQAAVANTASTAASAAASASTTATATATDLGSTIKNLFNTWFGGTSATGAVSEVTTAVQAIKDAVINGYTVQTITSSQSVPKPSTLKTELIVICVGGGRNGASGTSADGASGGAGGMGGGYIAQAIDPATVTWPVAATIAAAGANDTSFGPHVTSSPGQGGIASQLGYSATSSSPGPGGAGGTSGTSSSASGQAGNAGGSSALGTSGAAGSGGAATIGANGGAGSAGGAVSAATTTKCGGGGGGGGGGAGRALSAGGGEGGAGGYPGGGGGGGGSCTSQINTAVGAGGTGAAGIMWILTR